MTKRDYRKEAEKLVFACELLEEKYVRAFQKFKETNDTRELRKCELAARKLDKIDPDFKLQTDRTLAPVHAVTIKKSLKERRRDMPQREYFIRTAIRLLKQGKYKPLD